jgi:hypothetical protein
VHPLLMTQCAACHQGYGRSGDVPSLPLRNGGEGVNRFVLTGNPATDLAMTATLIDGCAAADSPLLRRASADENAPLPHPRVDRAGTPESQDDDIPLLAVGDPDYMTLFNWITAAATTSCP